MQEIPTYLYDDVNRVVQRWYLASTANQKTLQRWMTARKMNPLDAPDLMVGDQHRKLLMQFAREKNIR
jgi:hypothetical protein